ncbi:hypothetical protein JMJ77_0014621 [Colletotrichum scovillei]|uniref:Uncharacterized protein n=1 Tax=Colletotrichum scovillei TaxID=1209932 RepID=A0A9P7U889_9PEZI|nr:hypothetical protein JMJ77_0014621 [Colletotrichum scovillei]KAG7056230.1 hypothetical protein JMJ78_0000034 [Colletotrichum scovillei]KAG7066159.1 hypothetical protein JMJ76_0000027 [Colletotrichum scovillei]
MALQDLSASLCSDATSPEAHAQGRECQWLSHSAPAARCRDSGFVLRRMVEDRETSPGMGRASAHAQTQGAANGPEFQ